jgi:hypothetical protein
MALAVLERAAAPMTAVSDEDRFQRTGPLARPDRAGPGTCSGCHGSRLAKDAAFVMSWAAQPRNAKTGKVGSFRSPLDRCDLNPRIRSFAAETTGSIPIWRAPVISKS